MPVSFLSGDAFLEQCRSLNSDVEVEKSNVQRSYTMMNECFKNPVPVHQIPRIDIVETIQDE